MKPPDDVTGITFSWGPAPPFRGQWAWRDWRSWSAKRNEVKRSGFGHPFQAQQARLEMAS